MKLSSRPWRRADWLWSEERASSAELRANLIVHVAVVVATKERRSGVRLFRLQQYPIHLHAMKILPPSIKGSGGHSVCVLEVGNLKKSVNLALALGLDLPLPLY